MPIILVVFYGHVPTPQAVRFSIRTALFLSVAQCHTPNLHFEPHGFALPVLSFVTGQINTQKACNGFLNAIARSGLVSCWRSICRFARYL